MHASSVYVKIGGVGEEASMVATLWARINRPHCLFFSGFFSQNGVKKSCKFAILEVTRRCMIGSPEKTKKLKTEKFKV